MNVRTRLLATVLLLGGLVLAVGAPLASANFLLHLTIDSTCGSKTHTVTLDLGDMESPGSVTLIGQVQINGTFTDDTGSTVTVDIPTGTTSKTVNSDDSSSRHHLPSARAAGDHPH